VTSSNTRKNNIICVDLQLFAMREDIDKLSDLPHGQHY